MSTVYTQPKKSLQKYNLLQDFLLTVSFQAIDFRTKLPFKTSEFLRFRTYRLPGKKIRTLVRHINHLTQRKIVYTFAFQSKDL